MSFSYDVKTELCRADALKPCCRRALLYGLLLYGHSFAPDGIVLQTEHTLQLELAARLTQELFGFPPAGGSPGAFAPQETGRALRTLSFGPEQSALLFDAFGHDRGSVSLHINRANLENECCSSAFLRGAFLSCGSVVEPEKDYHLEFAVPHFHLSSDLDLLLREMGFAPKSLRRKGNYVSYFKESSQIEDLLTLMGAADKSLELMNVKIYKDFRNKANRATNCETANIEKTVAASAAQMAAIRKIMNSGGLEALEPDLEQVARLRLSNPEMTLGEMSASLKMSKSGVNHRLRRILEKSEKILP